MSVDINVANRLRRARDLNAGIKRDQELSRIGTLRGGSSGILSPDGSSVAGKCVRLSYLRSAGLLADEKITDSQAIIFDRGRDQEYSIIQDLKTSLEEDEVLLCEEEIPTYWETSNGVPVTGRPDGVICKVSNNGLVKTPVVGLEIKSIGSIWVTRAVLLEKSPPISALIQAAHYMWQLKLGHYKLIYRQNSQLVIPQYPFLLKLLPAESNTSHPLHGLIKYHKGRDGDSVPAEIKPYTAVFDLHLDVNGVLKFKMEGDPDSSYVSTVVDIPGIQSYFEFVSSMEDTGKLGPRPVSIDHSGKKLPFSSCDYCPMKATCDTYEGKGLKVWRREAEKQCTKLG